MAEQSDDGWAKVLEAASGDVRRLSYADRFTTIPVALRENVAEHSYWVSLYAVLVHRHSGGDPGLVAPIVLHAMTHDLIECITGDVVRTFKYSSKELKSAIDSAEDVMFVQLPEEVRELYPLWEQMAGESRPYVKAVVKAGDFMSLFQYMNRELLRGNREIEPFAERMKNDLRAMGSDAKSSPVTAGLAGLYSAMAERVGVRGRYTT